MDWHEHVDFTLTNQPPVSNAVVADFEAIRFFAKRLGHEMVERCRDGRELSIAMERLEETVMWAIKSIALQQEGR